MFKKAKVFALTTVTLFIISMIAHILLINNLKFNSTFPNITRKSPRIFCMITTHVENHVQRVISIKETWGKRCDVLLFVSSKSDPTLPAVKVCKIEDRHHLWCKTKEGLRYAYENYLDEADWFLKADDDTYVIVDNLKYFLSFYDQNNPIYFGCKFRSQDNTFYMSGG
jgi:glycoprotein-N-acetylgalactosamine 3-beta-galactosyltransferase